MVRLVSLRLRALTLEKLQLPTLSIWFTIKYRFNISGNWHGLREGLPTEWMPEPLFNFDGYLDSRARKGTNNFDPALVWYPFSTLNPPCVTHPVVSSYLSLFLQMTQIWPHEFYFLSSWPYSIFIGYKVQGIFYSLWPYWVICVHYLTCLEFCSSF